MDEQQLLSVNIVDKIAFITFLTPLWGTPLLGEVEKKVLPLLEQDLLAIAFCSQKGPFFLKGPSPSFLLDLKSEVAAISFVEKTQQIFSQIVHSPLPTFAFVDGACEAIGLEWVFACRHIFYSKNASFSLPYVHWGISPMACATLTLEHHLSFKESLEMLLKGHRYSAEQMEALTFGEGLYHAHEEDRRALAKKMASFLAQREKDGPLVKKSFLPLNVGESLMGKKVLLHQMRESLLGQTLAPSLKAPLKLLEFFEDRLLRESLDFETGLHQEAMTFASLVASEQAHGLLSFAEKSEKLQQFPKDLSPIPPHIGVIGLGTMGQAVAYLGLSHNYHVLLKDKSRGKFELGLQKLASSLGSDKDEKERHKCRLSPALDFASFRQCSAIFESTEEDLSAKRLLFEELGEHLQENTLLFTTTQTLSIGELAHSVPHPERFFGLLFFHPLENQGLVELVVHEKNTEEFLLKAKQLVLSFHKTPIVVQDAPAFVVNRLMRPYFQAAIALLEEGFGIEEIDMACKNFGMAVGPFRRMDEIGLPCVLALSDLLDLSFGHKPSFTPILKGLVQHGILGKQEGHGLYLYSPEGRVLGPNPIFKDLFPSSRQKKIPEKETPLELRCILPIIQEALYILDEGIVSGPSDIDVASVLGVGLPKFRGGILHFATETGYLNDLRTKGSLP